MTYLHSKIVQTKKDPVYVLHYCELKKESERNGLPACTLLGLTKNNQAMWEYKHPFAYGYICPSGKMDMWMLVCRS